MHRLIAAQDGTHWNAALAMVGEVDATCLPEYHLAYALRIAKSSPLLWHFTENGQHLVYPFLLTPVVLQGKATGLNDISSIYGYTGPIATTPDPAFLHTAWEAFGDFAQKQNIVAEFVRFSPFNKNQGCAHPETTVQANRTLAVSCLPATAEALRDSLGTKTRNMLRKAERSGLSACELALPDHLAAFRALYEVTMRRNQAPEFFWYDDAYWDHLLRLGDCLRLFATFSDGKMVAASMAVAYGKSGLYHLGAGLPEYTKLGAGNLSLYAMSSGLLGSGVTFLNMTGGRTVLADDPLLLFKRSNSLGTMPFFIGKRVVDRAAYNSLTAQWQQLHGTPPDAEKVIFWRP